MKIFPLLSASTRRNFLGTIFNATNGVNRPTSIFDVNTVINMVNDSTLYKRLDLSVTQMGAVDPMWVTLANSVGIELCENPCGFQNPCCDGQSHAEDKTSASFLRTGPGIYTFIFTVVPGYSFLPIGIAATHFSFNPPKNYGEAIIVNQVALATQFSVQYTIKTYNSAGVLADGIFDKTVMAMKFYPIYP
jgi:hypothetical protein